MKPILSAGFFLLTLTSMSFSQPANPYIFCPAVEITEAPPDDGSSKLFTSSGQHYTAFRGDTVYVVWAETRFATPPVGNHVFFAKSIDKGRSFGPNVRVNSTPSGFKPSMRVDTNGVIYVAYDGSGDIYFTKSTNGGNTFTPAIIVVDSAGLSYGQAAPSIAVNNKEQVFIAWVDYRTSPQSVFTTASNDGGLTFFLNVQVNSPGLFGNNPDIEADGNGRVFVVWDSFEPPNKAPTFLSRSDDSGQSFPFRSYVSDLPTDTTDALALKPSLSIGNDGLVGVAWEDIRYDQWTIHFSSSTDYGQTFSPSVRLDADTNSSCCPQPYAPSVVWKNGIFYVIFGAPSNTASSGWGIYFTYLHSDSVSFVTNVNASEVDSVPGRPGRASLAVNEKEEAYVAWPDNRYDPFISDICHMFGALGKTTVQKGDLNLDCLLTPADIVMELNAVFLRHSFPAPFEAADANCDSVLSPADVVLLLNATFNGDPFPC